MFLHMSQTAEKQCSAADIHPCHQDVRMFASFFVFFSVKLFA